MDLGPYTAFIATSYLAVAFVVIAMIGWIEFDYRSLKARLKTLENSGIVRRSGRSATDIR